MYKEKLNKTVRMKNDTIVAMRVTCESACVLFCNNYGRSSTNLANYRSM